MEASMPNPTDFGALNAYVDPAHGGVSHPAASPDFKPVIEELNSLLRGEISATEIYRMCMDKLIADNIDPALIATLREIQADHGRAAKTIHDRIRQIGGEPAVSAGAWGAWAKFAMGTAQIFGDTAALRSIKDAEEQGLKDLAASRDDLDTVSAQMVNDHLMVPQQRHIDQLDQVIRLMSA